MNIVSKFLKIMKEHKTVVQKIPVLISGCKIGTPLLFGRKILITGGTSGIGYSMALCFLENGADVVITGRQKEKIDIAVQKLLRQIKEKKLPTKIYGIELDNKQPATFDKKLLEINQCLNNKLDTLINNCGISGHGEFGSFSIDDFDNVLLTNLRGPFFLSQSFFNILSKNGLKGNILNVSSSSSVRPGISPYMLSKAAINSFTKGLAKKLLPYGIVVNGIAPGPTATPLIGIDESNIFNETNPSKRYATTEEIANLASILISDYGKMIIGETLFVTGGAGIITYDDIKY